jgi:hypothetical protein
MVARWKEGVGGEMKTMVSYVAGWTVFDECGGIFAGCGCYFCKCGPRSGYGAAKLIEIKLDRG